MDGVIAGLTTALVQGGDPSSLPTARTSLETAGKGLKEICDAAVKTVTPNTKGVWEEIAKGAVEPLFKTISDGVGALWTRHVEKDKLERRDEEDASWRPRNGPSSATSPRNSRRPFGAGRSGLRAGARAGSGAEGRRRTSTTARCSPSIPACIRPRSGAGRRRRGRFAVTGGDDRTVRIWSVADGKLLRTIWIPVGPENVGDVYAVAISPDGSTIAAGGWTERISMATLRSTCSTASPETSFGEFDGDLPDVTHFLTFSPDGRYLAATLGGGNGSAGLRPGQGLERGVPRRPIRRRQLWRSVRARRPSRHDSYDGMIRLYQYDPKATAQISPRRRAGQGAERTSPARRRFQSGRQTAGGRLL